jgi:hypothetical protein
MTSVYRYPLKAFTAKTDYLQIGITDYTPVGSSEDRDILIRDETGEPVDRKKGKGRTTRDPNEGFRRNRNKNIKSTILLPMPSNIQDGNAADYNANNLNNIQGALVSLGANFINTELNKNTINNILDTIRSAGLQSGINAQNAQDLLTNVLASKAAGLFGANLSFNQLSARQQGTILNPNMELLFNGPTLREFRFSFKLSPRNKDESKEVKNIIRTFKKTMAPKVQSGGLFMETPNIFELRYKQGSKDHSFLNKFKQCFLTNLSVNYTGEGTYSTYGDGTPVSSILDLTFRELDPIYDFDYDDRSAGIGVGY